MRERKHLIWLYLCLFRQGMACQAWVHLTPVCSHRKLWQRWLSPIAVSLRWFSNLTSFDSWSSWKVAGVRENPSSVLPLTVHIRLLFFCFIMCTIGNTQGMHSCWKQEDRNSPSFTRKKNIGQVVCWYEKCACEKKRQLWMTPSIETAMAKVHTMTFF